MVPRPPGTRNLSVEEIETIVDMSLDRESRPDIAAELDVNTSTVYKYQRWFGLV